MAMLVLVTGLALSIIAVQTRTQTKGQAMGIDTIAEVEQATGISDIIYTEVKPI
jgi:hypothetical protein